MGLLGDVAAGVDVDVDTILGVVADVGVAVVVRVVVNPTTALTSNYLV